MTRSSDSGDRKFVSPLARKIADEKKVDLSQILGTGPNNRIIAADVEEAAISGQSQPAVSVKKVTPAASAGKKAELPNHMFTDIENS